MTFIAILNRTARVALVVAFAAALAGCSQKSRCLTKGVDVEVASDHPHSASVPTEHVKRGIGGTYPVRGDGHEHVLVLKDEEMQKLQHGEPVTTRTSSVNAHAHEITVRCKK